MDLNQGTNYPKMTFEEMDDAIRDAEVVIKQVESYRMRMARFLCGRFMRPEKELRQFNASTGEWGNK